MSVEKINMHQIDKGQLRKLALSNRDNTDEAYRKASGEQIAKNLLAQPGLNAAKVLMCYRSFRTEVPTEKLIAELEAMGKTLCYPVCGKNGIMQAWHPLSKAAWKTGRMGIAEPDTENSRLIEPEDIDLVICPMVAFDASRQRMGYGGGYYDRFLPRCTKARRIGIAFEVQRMEALVTDEHDCLMDLIITEEKIY